MKIRIGFVSNSSTTSFCIFGISSRCDEECEDEEDMDFGEIMEEKCQKEGLNFHFGEDSEVFYIGVDAHHLPMDKTLNEMKVIISEKLKKLGVKSTKISWHEEAWRDG